MTVTPHDPARGLEDPVMAVAVGVGEVHRAGRPGVGVAVVVVAGQGIGGRLRAGPRE